MKKPVKKHTLHLNVESIKTLSEANLANVAGGRWYVSLSLCGGGDHTDATKMSCGSGGVRG